MSAPIVDWVIDTDTHITEPPGTYVDRIDKKFRDRAPRMQHIEKLGDAFVVDGVGAPIPMGLLAAAGKQPEEIRVTGVKFDEMHRGGWDPKARIAEQDRDGVGGELVMETCGARRWRTEDMCAWRRGSTTRTNKPE